MLAPKVLRSAEVLRNAEVRCEWQSDQRREPRLHCCECTVLQLYRTGTGTSTAKFDASKFDASKMRRFTVLRTGTGTVEQRHTVWHTVDLPNAQGSWKIFFASGAGGSLSRTKIRSGTRCAHQFWPQGARSGAIALARSQRNGRLPARAHASIKIGARIQSEFRIQIMHAWILNSACTRGL